MSNLIIKFCRHTEIYQDYKMLNQMFVLLLVATGWSLASQKAKKTFLQITPDPELGDMEMTFVQRGKISTITMKKDGGELITTEILSEKGYRVEKPEGANACYVNSLYEEYVEKTSCVKEILLIASQVPNTVADWCADRPMYALIPCANEGAGGSKRAADCHPYCGTCGGAICCGVECTFG